MDNSFSKYTRDELIMQIKELKKQNDQLKKIANTVKIQQKFEDKKPFNFEKCEFRHVLLKFLYLGWNYHGYVTQENITETIEHYIFKALIKTCLIKDRPSSNYHRCGRTDKGVSSFSQVISLDVRSKSDNIKDEFDYCNILNRVLPDEIQFVAWCPVEMNFSARFNCIERTYKYFFPKGCLDIEIMRTAATYILGTHDFRNFCKMDVNNGVIEYVRTITSTDITCFCEDENNSRFSIYVLTITGRAFLWHQIRCIVGILVLIGQRKEKPEVVLDLLDITANPKKPDYQMASEIPLNLFDCQYDNIEWIYNKRVLSMVVQKLHRCWTFLSIKSAMVENMLLDLQKHLDINYSYSSDCLIPGVKSKNYVPVMKRQLCDSLEEKLSKKQRKNEQTNQD